LIKYDKGIHLNDSIILDKKSAKNNAFNIISHAHSDHVNLAGKSTVIASPETIALIKANHCKEFKAIELPLKKKISIDSMKISFFNAGHILGSTQTLIEMPEETILYTGDFKFQDSLTQKKAEIIEADTLIIDSTYGFPSFVFPERKEVYEKMSLFIKKLIEKNFFVVLGGYALGKAQELTAFCNFYLNEEPLVHEKIYENNKIYEKFNVNLGNYKKLEHNLNESNILIVPPSLLNHNLLQVLDFSLKKKVVSVLASGRTNNSFNSCFPLSDHCSFNQLLDFISEVKPKKVYTVYGYARELAFFLRRKLKIIAKPLEEKGQSFLVEF